VSLLIAQGQIDRAEAVAGAVLCEARDAGDQRALGETFKNLGVICRSRGDTVAAEGHLQAAFENALRREDLLLAAETGWGGLLGLTLPMEAPERFARLLVMNTTLATGDAPLAPGFVAWRAYANKNPDLDCGKLLARACPHLSAAEAAAYEAPYPDAASKAGVRRFPALVPDNPEAPGAAVSRRARDWLQTSWKGDTFMAVGAKDPVLGPPVMNALRKIIRGCPEPWIHPEGGHFLQEWGDEVSKEALKRWT